MNEQKISFEIPSNVEVNQINFPSTKNYTLFMTELKRIAFGDDAVSNMQNDNNHHHGHGMNDEEYDRFVSDMWIGIVLTMLMVLIVFALCFWYMYHKFQQWKQSYDARSQMRHRATPGGTPHLDLETLPNYTLVSGLPTYDDALEQLRLSSTSNHLLINHQTLMKLFSTVKEKSPERTINDGSSAATKHRPESPVPSYEDAIRNNVGNLTNQHNLSRSNDNNNDIDGSNLTNIFFATQDGMSNNLTQPTSVIASSLMSPKSPALLKPGQQQQKYPGRSVHRFICTIVPPPTVTADDECDSSALYDQSTFTNRPIIVLPPIESNSGGGGGCSSSSNNNGGGSFSSSSSSSHDSGSATSSSHLSPSFLNKKQSRSQQLINLGSSSLGSLNIINEIKNSRPEIPWIHRSASISFDNELLHPTSNRQHAMSPSTSTSSYYLTHHHHNHQNHRHRASLY